MKLEILIEMCKAMGVPYAYPLPLYYTEDEPSDDEQCDPKYATISVKEVPYDNVPDGAAYLMNYQIFEKNEKQRPKLRTKIRKSYRK